MKTSPVLRFLFTLTKAFQIQLATTYLLLLLSMPRKMQITPSLSPLLSKISGREVCLAANLQYRIYMLNR